MGAENLIKEANNDAGWAAHPSTRRTINCNHFQIAMLAYNLNCWLMLVQPGGAGDSMVAPVTLLEQGELPPGLAATNAAIIVRIGPRWEQGMRAQGCASRVHDDEQTESHSLL